MAFPNPRVEPVIVQAIPQDNTTSEALRLMSQCSAIVRIRDDTCFTFLPARRILRSTQGPAPCGLHDGVLGWQMSTSLPESEAKVSLNVRKMQIPLVAPMDNDVNCRPGNLYGPGEELALPLCDVDQAEPRAGRPRRASRGRWSRCG